MKSFSRCVAEMYCCEEPSIGEIRSIKPFLSKLNMNSGSLMVAAVWVHPFSFLGETNSFNKVVNRIILL